MDGTTELVVAVAAVFGVIGLSIIERRVQRWRHRVPGHDGFDTRQTTSS